MGKIEKVSKVEKKYRKCRVEDIGPEQQYPLSVGRLFLPQTSKYLALRRPLYLHTQHFCPLCFNKQAFSLTIQIFGHACCKPPKLLNWRTEFIVAVPPIPRTGKNPRNEEEKEGTRGNQEILCSGDKKNRNIYSK